MKQKRSLYVAFALCLTLSQQADAFSYRGIAGGSSSQKTSVYALGNLIEEVEGHTGLDSIPKSGPAADYLLALQRFEPWAESTWHDYPQIPHSGYFGDGAAGGNNGIRGISLMALGYAVLVRAFPHDPKRQHRLRRIEEALRYLGETHESGPSSMVAVDGKKWGVTASSPVDPKGWQNKGWQSSMWTAPMGFTAALLEKELDAGVVAGCKRVVAAEADWLSKQPPVSGYEWDTKAEENGWQSTIVSIAAAWMPHDPRTKKWLRTAKLYLANIYTVPADTSGPLKEWITTQTLFPSYALQNHGFYHPDYQQAAGQSMGQAYLMARMVNPEVADEIKPFAEHNVENVWKFLKGLILNTGDLVFPSGHDWTLHSFNHVPYFAWIASHFHEPEARWAERQIAKQILYRQSITGDGRLVGESTTNLPFLREAISFGHIALAYLLNAIEGFPGGKASPPGNYIAHYEDVGLIVQRSGNSIITVSYSAPVMALVYPLKGKTENQRFFISPNTSTLLDIGPNGKAALKSFKRTASGFRAELDLDSRQGRKSGLIVESTPDAVVFIEIPYADSKLPSGGWLLSAIENDSLSGGRRTVLWDGNSTIIRERSGASTSPVSTNWLNIDNWMGFVTAQKGTLDYQATTKYNRDGAAEDYIYYQPKEQAAPRAVIVLPGETAAATASVSKSLKWRISGTECRLSFIRPGGRKMNISVPL